MLFFTKPKPALADLIPDGYTDIHSHLLPGIDDGSKDNEDTVLLINSLREYGFSQFITTPHVLTGVWNNTTTGITENEAATKAMLASNSLDMPFRAAAEYLLDDTFHKLLQNEPLLTLKDNYVLVEMSYLNPPIQLYDILFELQLKDYKPVLAHPERYLFYHMNFAEYHKLKKAGCLFQLNLLTVTGYYGKGVAETARKLLNADMIDFTGSDAHHTRHTEAFKNKIVLKDTAPLVKALNNNAIFV